MERTTHALYLAVLYRRRRQFHKVLNSEDETTETVDWTTENQTLVSHSSLPWNPRSWVRERLWVYWDGENQVDDVQKQAIVNFGKWETKIAYEASSSLNDTGFKCCTHAPKIRVWLWLFEHCSEGDADVDGLPIIIRCGIAEDEQERPVEEPSCSQIVGKCGTVTY